MRRLACVLVVLVLSLTATFAVAQPSAPAADRPEAVAAYNAGFEALMRGDFDAAIRGFDAAIAASATGETRAAATELRRLAAEMKRRGVRIAAPGTVADLASRKAEDRVAGRATFVISTTMASIYAGAVLIDLLDVGDDFRPSVVIIAGATAAGFLGSFYGSKGRAISEGAADTYTLGLGLGLGNGLLLAVPLGLDTSEEFQTLALGSLVAGGVAGMMVGSKINPTRGQASFVGTTSTLGLATTGLGLAILQSDSLDEDGVLLTLTAGLDAGAAVGMYTSRDLDWSLARARYVGLGTFLGAFAGWAAGALITGAEFDDNSDDDARIWASATLAGLWTGFGLTWHLTRGMTPDHRFAAAPARTTMVTPTMIGKTPGFAIAGRF